MSTWKQFVIDNHFILITSAIFLFLIIYSWMVPLILVSAVIGFYWYDRFEEKTRLMLEYLNEREHDRSVTNNLFRFARSQFLGEETTIISSTAVASISGVEVPLLLNSSHANCNNLIKVHPNQNSKSRPKRRNSNNIIDKKKDEPFDPLLHNSASASSVSNLTQPQTLKPPTRSSNSPVNKARPTSPLVNVNDSEINSDSEPSSSSSISPSKTKLTGLSRNETDLKIDQELDQHLSKLCNVIFNHYVSSDWAPYETRQQLRQAIRKLLVIFTERIKSTFFNQDLPSGNLDKTKLVNFCKNKIIPLLIYHLDSRSSVPSSRKSDQLSSSFPSVQSQSSSNRNSNNLGQRHLSAIQYKRLYWKVQRLCRQLLLELIPQEQNQCQLWVELCVSILGDGVIWNCILLGRDELPKIIEEALEHLLLNAATSNNGNCDQSEVSSQNYEGETEERLKGDLNSATSVTNETNASSVDSGFSEKDHITQSNIPNNTDTSMRKQVPMLLDSFLEPKYNDPEQPPPIVSKWRPTLNEILIQRDLLYSLIQYLRSERALEYLQAVLDDSPDGSAYCRRIIELEYLPSFCRSKLFLESLGLSRVEVGIEAGSELSLEQSAMKALRGGNLKKPSVGGQHLRTLSSGGGSGIWKSSVVDGLAMPPDAKGLSSSGASSTSLANSDTVDPTFRKRQHVLQPYLDKFYDSVTSFGKHPNNNPSGEKFKARRLGIDYRDYEEISHPEILSSICLEPCDTLTCLVEIGASWVKRAPWLESIIIGWSQLFHPVLNPRFDKFLEEKLNEVLTQVNLIRLIDLITEAFVESQVTPSGGSSTSFSRADSISKSTLSSLEASSQSKRQLSNSTISQWLHFVKNWIILNLFDYSEIVTAIHNNQDEFILFFVDLLDLLVNELTSCKPS